MELTQIAAGSVFADTLEKQAKSFALGERLARLHPELARVETSSYYFNVKAFAAAGKCSFVPRSDLHQQFIADWDSDDGVTHSPRVAWLHVTWDQVSLQIVKIAWESACGEVSHFVVMAANEDACVAFIDAVCKWNHEVRGEILVFSNGRFHKDTNLYNSIMAADLEQLVLEGSLKQQLRDDFTQFISSREAYEEHGVPWKRGALFVGPPGNGKTLCVKALVKLLGIPCLYVQSFDTPYGGTTQSSIQAVFERARATTPCVLVLEDLDSLVTDASRSFFLNELDGFATNTGVITLATTNHADKLDPAIVQRPSRFDRKYHFHLPDAPTRAQYVAMWNQRLRPTLRLSDDGRAQIVEKTEGFSFAYIQEVFVSSMMRWIGTRDAGGILPVALAQLDELRAQMTTK